MIQLQVFTIMMHFGRLRSESVGNVVSMLSLPIILAKKNYYNCEIKS